MAPSSSKKWLPLESNPEVIASFAHTLGLPADVGFHDIFGLDPDLLAMVRATRVDPAPRRRRPNPTR